MEKRAERLGPKSTLSTACALPCQRKGSELEFGLSSKHFEVIQKKVKRRTAKYEPFPPVRDTTSGGPGP